MNNLDVFKNNQKLYSFKLNSLQISNGTLSGLLAGSYNEDAAKLKSQMLYQIDAKDDEGNLILQNANALFQYYNYMSCSPSDGGQMAVTNNMVVFQIVD